MWTLSSLKKGEMELIAKKGNLLPYGPSLHRLQGEPLWGPSSPLEEVLKGDYAHMQAVRGAISLF